ncbi:MAG: glycosyltransferase [Chitinophagaceae bacterium]|jgi:L-malate glycosyltransferase|nr:glycosyltransferase [Chitinophagaceae bacterium]
MKVAFFSTLTNTSWGGSEVLWYKTALHMQKNGVRVAAFVKKWETEALSIRILREAGVEVFLYSTWKDINLSQRMIRKVKRHFFLEKNILDDVFKWEPDLVFFSQSHSYDLGYFPAKVVSDLLRTKIPYCIICQNNTDYSFVPETEVRSKIKQIYRRAEHVFFVSKRNRRTAEHIICVPVENSRILSNSISISANEVGILPYPNDEVIHFASVARLRCSHKGQNLLLDVFSQPVWRQRNWVLNFYGSGEDESYLKELVSYLRLEGKVNFNGQVSDIRSVWEKNHVLLLASFGEGMPLALQEAMLCGRPGVVTDVGGNSELIDDNVCGWIAKGNALASFSEALERAWDNRKGWAKTGELAFKKAIANIDLYPQETLLNYALEQTERKSKN